MEVKYELIKKFILMKLLKLMKKMVELFGEILSILCLDTFLKEGKELMR